MIVVFGIYQMFLVIGGQVLNPHFCIKMGFKVIENMVHHLSAEQRERLHGVIHGFPEETLITWPAESLMAGVTSPVFTSAKASVISSTLLSSEAS